MRILTSILLLIPSLYLGAQKDSLGTEPLDSNWLWFSDSMLTVLEEVNLEFQRIEGARGHRIEEDIDVESFQALNLAEGLKQNSALFVRSNGSNGVATLSVRGTSSSQSKVYWNGLDITPPNLALIDLSLLQSKPWESLEIDYGAGSLPLGSGSIGAALNLNTQWEGRGKRKSFLSLGGGSFGRQEYQGWAAYGKGKLRAQTSMSYSGINNDFQYRLPGENQRLRTQENADFDQFHAQQSLNYRINGYSFLNTNVWYTRTERSLPRIQLSQNALFDRMTDENVFWNNEYQRHFKDQKFIFQSQLGMVASSNRFQIALQDEIDRNDFQSFQGQLRLKTMEDNWFNGEIAWQGRMDQVQSDNYLQTEKRWQNALYGNMGFDLGDHNSAKLQLRSEIIDQDWAPLTGSFTWYPHFIKVPNFGQHLSISRNYRVPGLNDIYWQELGNPDLEPEESYQLNLGLDYQLNKSAFSMLWELHSYYMWVDNWIQWVPQNNIWRPLNLKTVHNYGLDFIWKTGLNREIWAIEGTLKYQFLQSEVRSSLNRPESIGNQIAYNPSHSVYFNPSFRYKQARLSYNLNYTDRVFIDEANQYYMPGYLLQDLQFSYRHYLNKHSLVFNFSLHNLGDIDYQVIAWRPEAGIHYRIGLQWFFSEK